MHTNELESWAKSQVNIKDLYRREAAEVLLLIWDLRRYQQAEQQQEFDADEAAILADVAAIKAQYENSALR